jgi:hypothetical protein
MNYKKEIQFTGVRTFAIRTMPTLDQNLQKSFQVPAQEKRNFKKCPTAQDFFDNQSKK